jgi:cytidylate kinase/UDP-2,3-diacylglucosamine diphosphatase
VNGREDSPEARADGARDGAAGGLPKLALPAGTLAIGDLHVDVESTEAVADFEAFVRAQHGRPCLIVLGDLFEYWIGGAQASGPGGRRALAALRELAASGTRVLVVPGNRDFLLGERDARAGGFELFPRGFVGRLQDGSRTLVVHGDELCTLDRSYQRLRAVVRSRVVRLAARALPNAAAHAIARRLRKVSMRAVAKKPSADKAPQRSEVVRRARASGANVLLNGHVHAFRDEDVEGVRWTCVAAFGAERDAFELWPSGWRSVASASMRARPSLQSRPMTIVAIDGPSGVGKSTAARLLAKRLGLFFLDTGAMYRAVTRAALERGVNPEDEAGCTGVARSLRLDFDDEGRLWVDGDLAGAAIRTEHVTRHVSPVSAHGPVRDVVVARQREIVAQRGGAVAEGRDTTTVVFPHADVKIFLTASAMERARRRATELGLPQEVGRILGEICRRDEFDSTRPIAPLVQAEDALRVETDGLSIEQVVERLAFLVAATARR